MAKIFFPQKTLVILEERGDLEDAEEEKFLEQESFCLY